MAKRYKEALVWWITQSSLGILNSPKTSPCWSHPHHFNQARMIIESPPQLWKWSIWKLTSPYLLQLLQHIISFQSLNWNPLNGDPFLTLAFFPTKILKKFLPLHNFSSSFILSKSLKSWISLMGYLWNMSLSLG